MKKQFLLPMVAVVMAVGGAFASNKFAPVYFEGDDQCETNQVPKPCEIGSLYECKNGETPYYYLPDASSPTSECQQLFTDIPPSKR